MPLYEYRCEACGGNEEKLESFSSPSEHDCPRCGASQGMKRQLSVSAFSLNGGGWYDQGYAKDASSSSSAAPSAPAGGCSGCPCAGSH